MEGPIRARRAAIAAEVRKDGVREREAAGWRVLVVDDDEPFAVALADALASDPGFEVVGVAHGVGSGFEAARVGVDVVLVDYRMPGGGGVALTRRIVESFPGLAVVAMSGSWDRSSRAAITIAGAVATIDKTAPVDDVCTVVRDACGRVARPGVDDRSDQP